MSFLSRWFSKPKSTETKFPNVVVGRIMSIENHPNADRLRCVEVDVGETLKIVCGAPNIEVGQLVPVAMVGASLPSGIVIQQAALRGVDSFGMLCAADELGIGTDHSGIMVLSGGTVGEPIDKYINS